MSEGAQWSSAKPNLAELEQLFGPPPVLTSESAESYERIMSRFMEDFSPRDFKEQMLVKELADCTWEMTRYTRQKALWFDRRFRHRLEIQAQLYRDAPQTEDARAKGRVQQCREPLAEPEDVLDAVIEDVDAMLLKPAAELHHLRALEVSLAYYEHLNKMLRRATARRNNIIDQIETYRHEFDRRLRRISDATIVAESAI